MPLIPATFSGAQLLDLAIRAGCPRERTFFLDDEYVIATAESITRSGNAIIAALRNFNPIARRNSRDCDNFSTSAASLIHEAHAKNYTGEHAVAVGWWVGISVIGPHVGNLAFTPPIPPSTVLRLTFFEPQTQMKICEKPESILLAIF